MFVHVYFFYGIAAADGADRGWEARVRDSRYPKQDTASLPISNRLVSHTKVED